MHAPVQSVPLLTLHTGKTETLAQQRQTTLKCDRVQEEHLSTEVVFYKRNTVRLAHTNDQLSSKTTCMKTSRTEGTDLTPSPNRALLASTRRTTLSARESP